MFTTPNFLTMIFKIPAKRTIYRKVYVLILTSGLFATCLFCSIYYYTIKQEKEVYQTSLKQFDNEVNSLIELNSQTNISNIVDMVYWDDFVNYVKTKDPKWFNANIPTSLDTYKADYLGIYDVKGNFINKSSTANIVSVDFIPKEVFANINAKKILQFYMKIPEGYVLICGASIHPSIDIYKRVTPSSGYFFIVKLLNKKYFSELETISSSKIDFRNGVGIETSKNLSIVKDIKDWKGETINHLIFKRPFDISFKSTKEILLLLFVFTIISILVFLWFFRKWIYKPLNLITGILEKGKESDMESLKNSPGEFSYIGTLFKENDLQRKEIDSAKAKAEESDRLKSSFLANMSHEIRTPMNAIVGFSELLLTENLSETERMDYIKVISSSGKNLVSIIEDLLEMSRIDTNQVAPNYSSVNIPEVVNELYNTIKISIPADKNIKFQVLKSKCPVTKKIITDQIKLKQILTNLITNAIKYTKQGHVIFGYEVNERDSVIEFTIKDSGIGIDKHYHKIIFDRFHRIDNDFTIKAGGLGLGLAISKAYVEMLGGNISIASNVKIGTTFSFTIPLQYCKKKDEDGPEIKNTNGNHPQQKLTILVAEDDNINFLLIQKIMQLKNYNIIRASNGQEAVDICQANENIDLILMDIKMPKLDGYQALKLIKPIRPHIKIIAQTAYSSIEDKLKIEAFGFDGYISKPIDKEELFELITKLTENKQ
jgi:signal transduction histidine kinase/ActR/RegA family two-component response regulator